MSLAFDKKIIGGIVLLVVLFFIVFRTTSSDLEDEPKPAGNSVLVMSVKDSIGFLTAPPNMDLTCENSKTIYIALEHGIYEYCDGSLTLIHALEDKKYAVSVACTEKYLIYMDNEYDTFRLDLSTGEKTQLFERKAVDIFAFEDDFFVKMYTPQEENSAYKLYIFEGDSLDKVELSPFLKNGVQYDSYIKGKYKDYELFGYYDSEFNSYYSRIVKLKGKQICQEDATYYINDSILNFGFKDGRCMNYYYDNQSYEIKALKDFSEYKYCIYGAFSTVYNDKLYTMVQFGTGGRYYGEPNPSYSGGDAIICLSPLQETDSMIYKTEDSYERIVGFDIEADVVYVYNDEYAEIRKVDMSTGEYAVIRDNLPTDTILHFEWCGDKLFIIDNCGYVYYTFVDAVS